MPLPLGGTTTPPRGSLVIGQRSVFVRRRLKKRRLFNCKYLMNNRNTLLRCVTFWNNIQRIIPTRSRLTGNKWEPPRTIQNWHFVRRMARRKSGVIPRIRAAQGGSDGRNFGERERVTEQVRRDYTKCKFCIIKGTNIWKSPTTRLNRRQTREPP